MEVLKNSLVGAVALVALVASTEVLPKDQIRMLSGDFVTREPGSLVITDELMRDSTIDTPDVFADNGVIHIVTEVILPYLPPSNCE